MICIFFRNIFIYRKKLQIMQTTPMQGNILAKVYTTATIMTKLHYLLIDANSSNKVQKLAKYNQ